MLVELDPVKAADAIEAHIKYNEVMEIINTSEEHEFSVRKIEKEIKSPPPSIKNKQANISNGNGFCIRCGANLKINPEKPLCFNCYKKLNK